MISWLMVALVLGLEFICLLFGLGLSDADVKGIESGNATRLIPRLKAA